MVVVEKERGETLERPIGVTTYFKKGQFEEHYAYVTTESGIKGGEGNKFYNLMGVYPQDELFPFNQYDAYITAGRHESCLYIDKTLSLNCEFEMPFELILKVSDVPYSVTKGDAGWPKDLSELENEPEAISYTLKNAITELWVRRNKVGANHIWDGTYTYKSGAGQPVNDLDLPSQFVDPLDDLDASFGRPIWAWRHNPSQGSHHQRGGWRNGRRSCELLHDDAQVCQCRHGFGSLRPRYWHWFQYSILFQSDLGNRQARLRPCLRSREDK